MSLRHWREQMLARADEARGFGYPERFLDVRVLLRVLRAGFANRYASGRVSDTTHGPRPPPPLPPLQADPRLSDHVAQVAAHDRRRHAAAVGVAPRFLGRRPAHRAPPRRWLCLTAYLVSLKPHGHRASRDSNDERGAQLSPPHFPPHRSPAPSPGSQRSPPPSAAPAAGRKRSSSSPPPPPPSPSRSAPPPPRRSDSVRVRRGRRRRRHVGARRPALKSTAENAAAAAAAAAPPAWLSVAKAAAPSLLEPAAPAARAGGARRRRHRRRLLGSAGVGGRAVDQARLVEAAAYTVSLVCGSAALFHCTWCRWRSASCVSSLSCPRGRSLLLLLAAPVRPRVGLRLGDLRRAAPPPRGAPSPFLGSLRRRPRRPPGRRRARPLVIACLGLLHTNLHNFALAWGMLRAQVTRRRHHHHHHIHHHHTATAPPSTSFSTARRRPRRRRLVALRAPEWQDSSRVQAGTAAAAAPAPRGPDAPGRRRRRAAVARRRRGRQRTPACALLVGGTTLFYAAASAALRLTGALQPPPATLNAIDAAEWRERLLSQARPIPTPPPNIESPYLTPLP